MFSGLPAPLSFRLRSVLGWLPGLAALGIGAALCGLWQPASAQPMVGQSNGAIHLGVQSCGSSACHSADKPWPNSRVRQDEALTWAREDRHARAYRTLLTEQSQRIAHNLGLESAAMATLCLDCHADNATPTERGPLFNLADGVGCERCHGGAAKWLGPHAADTGTRRATIQAGLYPTDEPVARAQLCISCHQRADHRLYGAGHPRLTFELDTFTANQPAHFRHDADYRLRKDTSNGVKLWAIGQAVAASTMLETIASFEERGQGLMPELAFFDCHSCHRRSAPADDPDMSATKVYRALPTVNDSGLIMLGIVAEAVAPQLAPALRAETASLRDASTGTRAGLSASARRVHDLVQQLLQRLVDAQFTVSDREVLLQSIKQRGQDGAFHDFADAEQAVMAVAAIVAASRLEEGTGGAIIGAAERALDSLYDSTRSEGAYRPSVFQQALGRLGHENR